MTDLVKIDANYWIYQDIVNVRTAAYLISGFQPPTSNDFEALPLFRMKQAEHWITKNVKLDPIIYGTSSNSIKHDGTVRSNGESLLMMDLLEQLASDANSAGWGGELLAALKHNTHKDDQQDAKQEQREAPRSSKTSNGNDDSKVLIQEQREDCLNNWIKEKKFPDTTWKCHGYTKEKMYTELVEKYPGKFDIEFSVFDRVFWQKQKICKFLRDPENKKVRILVPLQE